MTLRSFQIFDYKMFVVMTLDLFSFCSVGRRNSPIPFSLTDSKAQMRAVLTGSLMLCISVHSHVPSCAHARLLAQ